MTTSSGVVRPDESLAGHLRHWAAARGGEPALSCEDVTRTWAQLHDRCSRLAQALVAAGVRPGDRVAHLGLNGAEALELLLASGMAGAVHTGVSWRLSPRETEAVLAHAGVSVLVVAPEQAEVAEALRSTLPALERVVVTGDSYEEWLAAPPADDPMVAVSGDDLALMMYTSGTTGLPKGVTFTHRGFRATAMMEGPTGTDVSSTALVAMPLFHSAGLSFAVMALGAGAHIVVAREAKPSHLLDLLERWRVTVTMLVPAVLRTVVAEPGLDRRDLSALRTIVYAASPVSPELLSRCLDLLDVRMIQNYGLTETQSATVLSPEDHLDRARPHLLESAGREAPGARVQVRGADGALLPDGEVGEVWVHTPAAMAGYWDDPEQTRQTVDDAGWIRTGDAGCLRDGYLYLRDRIKDMIVSGGMNVYPVEVENVLHEHPAVRDVAVIGVPSERWGETVLAVVVTDVPAPSVEELVAHCRDRLAAYKCPTLVEVVTELPRNPSGKVLKRVLREPYWAGRDRRIG